MKHTPGVVAWLLTELYTMPEVNAWVRLYVKPAFDARLTRSVMGSREGRAATVQQRRLAAEGGINEHLVGTEYEPLTERQLGRIRRKGGMVRGRDDKWLRYWDKKLKTWVKMT